MTRIAYGYTRMSRPGQLKGDSSKRQVEASEKYAAENDLKLDETLDLCDLGMSAFTHDNVVQGFRAAIDSGTVAAGSTLLVESLGRLSRQRVGADMSLFLSIVERDGRSAAPPAVTIYSGEGRNIVNKPAWRGNG